ncbi:UNVERIFIED_CONTAM: hypothetical protein NY603_34230, partial [Bacteroidetes bacterium 56_B9]
MRCSRCTTHTCRCHIVRLKLCTSPTPVVRLLRRRISQLPILDKSRQSCSPLHVRLTRVPIIMATTK